jgi:putative PEP-CTERM system histidine kinase
MVIGEIAVFGYALAAAMFLTMAIFLLTRWRDHSKSHLLALPAFFSAAWAAVEAGTAAGFVDSTLLNASAEFLRSTLWAFALGLILRSLVVVESFDAALARFWPVLPVAALVIGLPIGVYSTLAIVDVVTISVCLTLATLILFLAEQIFRNTPHESGSGLRYFCLAIAGMFVYDVIFNMRELFLPDASEQLWAARGLVNAMLAAPVFYAIKDRFNISLDNLLPRQIVFYSLSLIALGVLVVSIAAGDYFIRRFGGSWTDVLRILFAVALLMFISALLVSRAYRNKARVLMMKALFQYKYDYRREWLRFIATLSQTDPEREVLTTAVRAIAQIVNSPGGVVWVQQQDDEDYLPAGAWNCELPLGRSVKKSAGLISFLNESQWVIDLEEMEQYPARYDERGRDGLPGGDHDWWLIVPMLLGDRLSGFLTLLRPDDVPVLNFEDHDLLKTAGRHVATHIEQVESDRRLSEARQFGAYNRLTAFLMHDLNNLLAQQSLVVENAERFRHNPDFVDDAIGTISHSVDRMRRLMEQLSSPSKVPAKRRINLNDVLNNALERTSRHKPRPVIGSCDKEIHVLADSERLSMVIQHLLRNAQEATADDGRITIEASSTDTIATITIADTGTGMTQEFIRTRLFRPFDSTKGSQGMGIGVYQAREYARALGGHIEVSSQPDVGTEFTVSLPLAHGF